MSEDTWCWARWWDRRLAGGGGEDVVHGGISNDTNGSLARDDLALDTSGKQEEEELDCADSGTSRCSTTPDIRR
jgi:hypothetical protein